MVKKKRTIRVLRSERRIVIDPTTPRVRGLLEPQLRYVEKIFHRGVELIKRLNAGLSRVEEVTWECYGNDIKGRLATSWGFYERIAKTLRTAGYTVELYWATDEEAELSDKRDETVYRPNWDRIAKLQADGYKFKFKQKKALRIFTEFENGCIDCPTGWGKGDAIVNACILFDRARIGVVAKDVAVLRQRLYPALAMSLPSVGIVGGGMKRVGRRVMCYTADSLHHAPADLDMLFIDEGHKACADKFAASLARFGRARVWMFSASWNKRLDNKDLRAEAIAGPIRLVVPYQEAVDHNMVVPIAVIWDNVSMDVNPCSDVGMHEKKRYAYWANEYRNKKIAAIAHRYSDDMQTLITVETLEHALNLKRLLPEFTLVYSARQIKPSDMKYFRDLDLIPPDWRTMTDDRKERLTQRFTKGKLKKVIVTTVWNVGVSFNHLRVLIRADGGASPINDTQIPGRTSRLNEEAGKLFGIVHDLRDQFDNGCKARAKGREKSYAEHKWVQYSWAQAQKQSRLQEQLGWSK